MPVTVNELEVIAEPQAPAAAPAQRDQPRGGASEPEVAEFAERAWRRVAELGERVRAD